MFSNYLKITLRVLWRNKIYTTLNVVGLGFAIACCILAYLNYNYRNNFDQSQAHAQHIYRLNSMRVIDGSKQPWGVIPLPVVQAMQNELKEEVRIARLNGGAAIVKQAENTFDEHIYYADKTLFDFFSLPLKSGNLSGFDEPDRLIISEDYAEKYFPKQIAVGQPLTIIASEGKPRIFTVAAVTQKIPGNSSIQFDMLTSFDNQFTNGQVPTTHWTNPQLITTFVDLKDEKTARFVTASLNPYLPLLNRNGSGWHTEGFSLQRFSELAASSDIDMPGYVYGSQLASNPRGVLVIVPAIMSIFLLLITCFNFTNISIAFASRRLKEIGIRKVMGGIKSQLIRQFLSENLVLCLLASILAMLFVRLLLPAVFQFTNVDLSPEYAKDYGFWLFLICIPCISAVFSGLYPAIFVSSFQAIATLKGKTSLGSSNRFTRFLLISQFTLSCFALVVGIVMSKNAAFQKKADFGYSINEIAVVEINNPQQYNVFSQAIQQNPAIKSVAGCTQQIGDNTYTQTAKISNEQTQVQVAHVGGKDYLTAMGIALVQGRHFYDNGADATQSILVNQTFVQRMQLENPLGQQVALDSINYTIVGVVNDYKEYGLHDLVPPCVLRMATTDAYKFMIVRADKDKLNQVTKYLQASWHNLNPNTPYRGYLQSDLIEKEIRMTQGFKSIAFFLAIITLLLSASGLFAQISLNIDKRSKEIGIRKVLGASILQIIVLVNRELTRMLLIAFIIGSALGYLFTSQFIFQVIYRYHPPAGPEPYLLTLLIVIICCSLIIGTKVFKAAKANPIERLRDE